jgi:hypothetical protein
MLWGLAILMNHVVGVVELPSHLIAVLYNGVHWTLFLYGVASIIVGVARILTIDKDADL